MVSLLLSGALAAPAVRLDQNLTSGWESVRVREISDSVPVKGWAKVALPNTTFVPAPGNRRHSAQKNPQGRAAGPHISPV